MRVTACVQRVFVHERQAERTAHSRQQFQRRLFQGGIGCAVGQQRTQDVRVGCRRSRAAPANQPRVAGTCGKGSGVDQISVVPQCNSGAGGGVAEHRLGVFPRGVARGGVTAVPDGDVAVHCRQRLLVEHLADQTKVFEDQHLRPIGDSDSRGFLAAMLQRIQSVVGEFGYFFARGPDPEYTALFTGRVQILLGFLDGHDLAAPRGTVGDVTESTATTAPPPNPSRVSAAGNATLSPKTAVQVANSAESDQRKTRGSQCPISPAREPDKVSAPVAVASASPNSPVASSSHVRGSASTTLGGVPRVCLGPEMHCTAANGGIRTSTLAPGASAARVRAVSRTAVPSAARSGGGRVSSHNQSATASTTCRVFAGSALSRAVIPLDLRITRRGRRRKRPPYKTIGLVTLMVMVFACPGLYLQFAANSRRRRS